jgi:hypothetical protein
MKGLTTGSLTIDFKIINNEVILAWCGKSDERNPSEALNPYLDSLIDELKGKIVSLEYLNLEYMNSSTVPPIVQFIKKLNTNNIETKIIYNSKSKWQSASFKALDALSKVMQHITVLGK